MSSFHLNATVAYADGWPASGLSVHVLEAPHSDYDLGQTDANGKINADIRGHRQVDVANDPLQPWKGTHQADDMLDHPFFTIQISVAGHSFKPPPYDGDHMGDVHIILPSIFPSQSPSALADRALSPVVDSNAPGREFLVRKNGEVWAQAAHGSARLPVLHALQMTNDTIIHIASMSKPICATAVVAMIEDWMRIQREIAALNAGQQPNSESLSFSKRDTTGALVQLGSVAIPGALVPLFADRSMARAFLEKHLIQSLPDPARNWITRFANEKILVKPVPVIPPGHFALLRRVLQGTPPPDYTSPFLPLVRDRLAATALGAGQSFVPGSSIPTVTLQDLLIHTSSLLNDADLTNADGFAAVKPAEPTDGSHVTCNLWAYLVFLLRQNATSPVGYKNQDYAVLGGIVENCTEMPFDDFVVQRLFFDQRFNKIRRHVVDGSNSAWYYQRNGPGWTIGNPFPDYTGFLAAGGWYVTASQITDWMHVLFTLQPVATVLGQAPLISQHGHHILFGLPTSPGSPALPPYFCGCNPIPTLGAGSAISNYRHNGGTGIGVGSVNGKMSILIGPGESVHTAFFAGNGSFSGDQAFDRAIQDLINISAWS